jgi:Iodothyronine deiodinase
MSSNDQAGIAFMQPTTFSEREKIAESCSGKIEFNTPVLVDGIDNKIAEAYSAFPDRLFIIDRSGKVAYKGGRGPFGYKAQEMEQHLILLLMEEVLQAQKVEPTDVSSDEPAKNEPAEKSGDDANSNSEE